MGITHRWQGVLPIALMATLLGTTTGWSQTSKTGTLADRMVGLRVGHWVQLEGMVRGSSPVHCSEVRPLAGDFLDDDNSLKGLVKSVDSARQEFTIGACHIRVTGNTVYDNPKGTLKGIADMRPGMIVDVEGTLLQDGTLLAAEVDDESEEIAENPKVRDEIEVIGKIERIDLRRHVLTVMGIEFQINARTRLLSAIH